MVSINKFAKILLMLTIICLIAISVSAETYTASMKTVNTRILPGQTAQYELTIENLDSYPQTYIIGLSAADAPGWIQTPNAINVEPGETITRTITVKPKTTTALGSYILSLKINDIDDTTKTIGLPLILTLDAFTSGYKPDIALNVDIPAKQDPREKLKINVLLRNRNPLDIEQVIIEMNSELFAKKYNTSLGPRKELTNEFVFELDPLAAPKEYNLNVKVNLPTGETISEANKKLVLERYSTIEVDQMSSTNWFYTEESVILTNEGNHERIKEIKIRAPWYNRIFFSAEPGGELIHEEGKAYVKWDINLKPTETKNINIYWNYRPLVIAILIFVLLIVLYFVLRTPLLILKEASILKEDSEGISEIKIRLFIKNRSSKKLNSITITDMLPRITQLINQENTMGSLKPTKVTNNAKKGTILYWDIDNLEPYEERIITYKIKSKLKVIGNINLPRSIVKFDSGKGNERKTESKNPVFIKN